ncbi:hypothetical protein AX16_010039 [Volvariella volvacea WC 439]|nr:hypothetical protein AX16_010039 [Volvariella volvacea WC 439]
MLDMVPSPAYALSPELWSRLPIELLREILLFVVARDPRRGRQLRLISRHVNVWILPAFFQTLTLTTADRVIQFTSTLLPKRKITLPGLKSHLHVSPRPLSSYTITSLAYVINARLPSLEVAMAKVAPALTHLQNLAITGQNFISHAHWLRQSPIRPRFVMLLHFGRPQLVSFHEPIFQEVTHLYTAILDGSRMTSVADLPALSHLALHTRVSLDIPRASEIARTIVRTLQRLPRLKMLVFTINANHSDSVIIRTWRSVLEPCFADERFYFLPNFVSPRQEWTNIVTGLPNIWDRALLQPAYSPLILFELPIVEPQLDPSPIPPARKGEPEWEIDMVQRENFAETDEDPTELLYRRTTFH